MTVISISMAYLIVFISRMLLGDSKTILFCSVRIVIGLLQKSDELYISFITSGVMTIL